MAILSSNFGLGIVITVDVGLGFCLGAEALVLWLCESSDLLLCATPVGVYSGIEACTNAVVLLWLLGEASCGIISVFNKALGIR